MPRLDSPPPQEPTTRRRCARCSITPREAKENPAALAYLQKRGIGSEEAIATFKLGFVDRTLGLRLPQANRKEGAALRARLTRLGILRDTGHEHLRGRIVFPVLAENGEIGTVYGRAIDDGENTTGTCFCRGRSAGCRSGRAAPRRKSWLPRVVDALDLSGGHGFRHVTTAYSAKALPKENCLRALLAAKVRRVSPLVRPHSSGDEGAGRRGGAARAYATKHTG